MLKNCIVFLLQCSVGCLNLDPIWCGWNTHKYNFYFAVVVSNNPFGNKRFFSHFFLSFKSWSIFFLCFEFFLCVPTLFCIFLSWWFCSESIDRGSRFYWYSSQILFIIYRFSFCRCFVLWWKRAEMGVFFLFVVGLMIFQELDLPDNTRILLWWSHQTLLFYLLAIAFAFITLFFVSYVCTLLNVWYFCLILLAKLTTWFDTLQICL